MIDLTSPPISPRRDQDKSVQAMTATTRAMIAGFDNMNKRCFTNRNGWHVGGWLKSAVTGKTTTTCQEMCRDDAKCTGVVWNVGYSKCFLVKHSRHLVTRLIVRAQRDSYNCYYKTNAIAGFDDMNKRCMNKNNGWSTKAMGKGESSTIKECQELCRWDQDCSGVAYNVEKQKCHKLSGKASRS